MRSTNKLPLSRQAVDRLPVAGREVVFWDQHLPGFGIRVYPSGNEGLHYPGSGTDCGQPRRRHGRAAGRFRRPVNCQCATTSLSARNS